MTTVGPNLGPRITSFARASSGSAEAEQNKRGLSPGGSWQFLLKSVPPSAMGQNLDTLYPPNIRT